MSKPQKNADEGQENGSQNNKGRHKRIKLGHQDNKDNKQRGHKGLAQKSGGLCLLLLLPRETIRIPARPVNTGFQMRPQYPGSHHWPVFRKHRPRW